MMVSTAADFRADAPELKAEQTKGRREFEMLMQLTIYGTEITGDCIAS